MYYLVLPRPDPGELLTINRIAANELLREVAEVVFFEPSVLSKKPVHTAPPFSGMG